MTKDEAIKRFETQKGLGAALGVDQSTISGWKDFPPPWRQLQIEALTNGALKAEPDCDKYRAPAKAAA